MMNFNDHDNEDDDDNANQSPPQQNNNNNKKNSSPLNGTTKSLSNTVSNAAASGRADYTRLAPTTFYPEANDTVSVISNMSQDLGDGRYLSLDALNGILLVRQTVKGHRAVREILVKMGAVPAKRRIVLRRPRVRRKAVKGGKK